MLGNDAPIASVQGEIVVDHPDGFYSYAAKYIDETGATLRIPADLAAAQANAVQLLSVTTFRACSSAPGSPGSTSSSRADRQLYVQRDQHHACPASLRSRCTPSSGRRAASSRPRSRDPASSIWPWSAAPAGPGSRSGALWRRATVRPVRSPPPTRVGARSLPAGVPDGWQRNRGATFGGLVIGNLVRAITAFDDAAGGALPRAPPARAHRELCRARSSPGSTPSGSSACAPGRASPRSPPASSAAASVLAHAVGIAGRSASGAEGSDFCSCPRPVMPPWRDVPVIPVFRAPLGPTFARASSSTARSAGRATRAAPRGGRGRLGPPPRSRPHPRCSLRRGPGRRVVAGALRAAHGAPRPMATITRSHDRAPGRPGGPRPRGAALPLRAGRGGARRLPGRDARAPGRGRAAPGAQPA